MPPPLRLYHCGASMNTSESRSHTMSNSERAERIRLAMASNTPPSMLSSLAKEGDDELCRYVASNKSTPSETLFELARKEWFQIRAAVAGNKNCPKELHDGLIADSHKEVRRSLTQSHDLYRDQVATLASDVDCDVRYHAASQRFIDEESKVLLAGDPEAKVAMAVARLRLPDQAIKKLVEHQNCLVREAIAENELGLPLSAQERLATDKQVDVVLALSLNKKIDRVVVVQLLDCADNNVRVNAFCHPSLAAVDVLRAALKEKIPHVLTTAISILKRRSERDLDNTLESISTLNEPLNTMLPGPAPSSTLGEWLLNHRLVGIFQACQAIDLKNSIEETMNNPTTTNSTSQELGMRRAQTPRL